MHDEVLYGAADRHHLVKPRAAFVTLIANVTTYGFVDGGMSA